MPITNQELLTLFENQIGVGVTSSSTSPTRNMVLNYLNISQKQIARSFKPQELFTATPATITTVANTSKYAVPATVCFVSDVYVPNASDSTYERCVPKDLNNLINPTTYFDTTQTGDPKYYDVKGNYILFDKAFADSGLLIKVFGTSYPTVIDSTNLASNNEFADSYAMLLIYKAAVLWFNSDDDTANVNKFQGLYKAEASELVSSVAQPGGKTVSLDGTFFKRAR